MKIDTKTHQAILAGKVTQGMTFSQKVWALTARIPAGQVATYGDIAAQINPKASRAVGQALNRNPYAPDVPCHRVVGGDGQLTGFARGLKKKTQLLREEGVAIEKGRVNLSQYRYKPTLRR